MEEFQISAVFLFLEINGDYKQGQVTFIVQGDWNVKMLRCEMLKRIQAESFAD